MVPKHEVGTLKRRCSRVCIIKFGKGAVIFWESTKVLGKEVLERITTWHRVFAVRGYVGRGVGMHGWRGIGLRAGGVGGSSF